MVSHFFLGPLALNPFMINLQEKTELITCIIVLPECSLCSPHLHLTSYPWTWCLSHCCQLPSVLLSYHSDQEWMNFNIKFRPIRHSTQQDISGLYFPHYLIPVAATFTSNLNLNSNYIDFMNFSILSALLSKYVILCWGSLFYFEKGHAVLKYHVLCSIIPLSQTNTLIKPLTLEQRPINFLWRPFTNMYKY